MMQRGDRFHPRVGQSLQRKAPLAPSSGGAGGLCSMSHACGARSHRSNEATGPPLVFPTLSLSFSLQERPKALGHAC